LPYLPVLANEFVVLKDEQDGSRSALGRARGGQGVVFHLRPRLADLRHHAAEPAADDGVDLLLDDAVKLVTLLGSVGMGKTLLALAAGMNKTHRRLRRKQGAGFSDRARTLDEGWQTWKMRK
jgi:PhoH-like ATPase